MLPPRVPALRTCGRPAARAAAARPGIRAAKSGRPIRARVRPAAEQRMAVQVLPAADLADPAEAHQGCGSEESGVDRRHEIGAARDGHGGRHGRERRHRLVERGLPTSPCATRAVRAWSSQLPLPRCPGSSAPPYGTCSQPGRGNSGTSSRALGARVREPAIRPRTGRWSGFVRRRPCGNCGVARRRRSPVSRTPSVRRCRPGTSVRRHSGAGGPPYRTTVPGSGRTGALLAPGLTRLGAPRRSGVRARRAVSARAGGRRAGGSRHRGRRGGCSGRPSAG